MRLRKVKNAKERLMDGNYFIEDPIHLRVSGRKYSVMIIQFI